MADRQPRFRLAGPDDAAAIAALHADSWRRNYRGAYSDTFLDGDVLADRLELWSERLRLAGGGARTLLAEDARLLGFAHVIFDEDPTWGALLDNMHVAASHRRRGIGSCLLSVTARAVADRAPASGLYLWVLDQNAAAQAFYEAHGGAVHGAGAGVAAWRDCEPPRGNPDEAALRMAAGRGAVREY